MFFPDFQAASKSGLLPSLLLIALFAALLTSCQTTAGPGSTRGEDRIRTSEGTFFMPFERLPDLDEMRRGELLEAVHPELVDRIRLLYALLEVEGIEITFLSGHRPYDPNYRPNRLATWHNLGMAVDLNIAGRPYQYFEEDEWKWERIGEIAAGLGIIWGRRYNDIFHFEWHPGYYARIRPDEFAQFQSLAGRRLQNHRALFPLFDPALVEPEEPHCFGGCLKIPDEGLRRLLEQVRL